MSALFTCIARLAYGKQTNDSRRDLSHGQEETTLETEDDIFAKTNEAVDLNERTTQDTLDVLNDGRQHLEGRIRGNDVVYGWCSVGVRSRLLIILTELERVLLDLVRRLVDNRHNVLLVAAREITHSGNCGDGVLNSRDTRNAGHNRANGGERRERRREGAEGGDGKDGEAAEGEHLEKSVGAA